MKKRKDIVHGTNKMKKSIASLLLLAVMASCVLSQSIVSYAVTNKNMAQTDGGGTTSTTPRIPTDIDEIKNAGKDVKNSGTSTGLGDTSKKSNNKKNDKKEQASDGSSSSSWLHGHSDDTIYGDGDSAVTISDEDEEESKPGVVAGLFIDLICDITNWCHSKMESIGMSLDSIVLGRVGGHGVAWNGYRVALFTFEMRPGNPYGVVASAVYNTIRGILYIIITLIVLAKLVMAAYAGGSTKALSALKESLSSYILAIMMLTLMPYLFDVLLYVRDVILYTVTSNLGADVLHLDVSELSIIDMFKDIASKSVMNSFMYLGTVLLTLWFAMTYSALAMGYIIYFFAFPFVCMNMQFEKNALGEWWKQMIYSMLIPISDIVLLFIPLAFGSLGNTTAIHTLQFLICTMLIPARAQLRNAMGIRTNMGMEMAGIATLMGAASFARSAVGTAARVGAGLSGAASDRKMSNMYGEMAANENAQRKEFADMYNQENGYGMHGGVAGAKEVHGIDSMSSGMAGLSNSYGLPTGAFDDSNVFNNDSSHLSADVGRGGAGGGMGYSQNQDVLEKYANMSNFENPEFKGISAEKKAELYKQRSRRRLAQAATTAVGGTVGAGVGLGAATFFSPGVKAQMAGLGMSAGAGIGAAAPSVASTAAKGISAAGRTAYDLGAYSQLTGKSLPQMGMEYAKGAAANTIGDIKDAASAYSRYGSMSAALRAQFAEADNGFSDNVEAINTVTQQALDLNGYLDQATSPDNEELSSYMEQAYSEIMGNKSDYDDVPSMRNAMSQKCVEHVLAQAEPYYTSNINGKDNADPDVIDKIVSDNRRLAGVRIRNDLSPANISKYGNGKYTFQ